MTALGETTLDENALDGNAIAGTLVAVFGEELTAALGTCAHCGASSVVAEVAVYMRGPGTVARCRHCDTAIIVLVDVRGVTCVDTAGLRSLQSRAQEVGA
jgi:hypothetical protein